MPNVAHIREEVQRLLPKWSLIRDCLLGQQAIKEGRTKYLPIPNAADKSEENRARYEHYLERAVFYNVTQRTHAGLVGQVFQHEPMVELPALLEPLLVDVDGAGVSLYQQAKKALSEVLAYGRCGLLVDYPNTSEPASRQEIVEGYLRPTIVLYEPWDIINWRTKTVGARKLLSLVVLSEQYIAEDDGFELKYERQWRVLRLEEETGYYRVEIWREDSGAYQEYERYYPTDAAGNHLTEIPFTFVGAINNDPHPDEPPLYDLAVLNIAHYRNSADYEESCFMAGQPTPFLAGLTKDWVEDVLKGGIYLGSRKAIPLPQGGTAGLLQAQPNSLPFEAMQHKERQMVALGAKLVEQRQVQRTLGEARLEEASEVSILVSCTNNVAEAYRKCLTWAGMFAGVTDGIEFELNTDFEIGRMTAQERAQLLAEWQGGGITFEEYRYNLKRANIAYLDDEEAKAAIQNDLRLGVGGFELPVGDDKEDEE